ncbi:MAG: 5-methylthioadenosine/S-adenosylhomocysteine deaminase [Solirubrobacteraceae bacterium]
MAAAPFNVRPVVSWPRRANAGERYLLTVDLEPAHADSPWPYEDEDVVVHCIVDALPFFDTEPLDDSTVVLHRFGGSYGPARYVLTAAERPMQGAIHLALVNEGGVPIGAYRLDGVDIVTDDEDREIALRRPSRRTPARRPRSARRGEPLIIRGQLVTFDDSSEIVDDGALYVDANGRIAGARSAQAPPLSGFSEAPVLDTEGVVYPGLIDLHNPIMYSTLGLWAPEGRRQPFTSRFQWTTHHSYRRDIANPAQALGALAGRAVIKYAEAKSLVGGTTAIQGAGRTVTRYEGWVLRSALHETFGTSRRRVYSTTLMPRSERDFRRYAERLHEGSALIANVAEGTGASSRREFHKISDNDWLQPGFVGLHCIALDRRDFRAWGQRGGTVLWCPFSNLWWYGQTTDIIAAREAGLRTCLASDWSPSGSKNLLGELKVADLLNRTALSRALSDEAICRMAISDAADAIGWESFVGRLKVDRYADVLVLNRRHEDPYRNLITALADDVMLVAIAGRPHYGHRELMPKVGSEGVESTRIGPLDRAISLGSRDDSPEPPMGLHLAVEELEAVRADPIARYLEVEKAGGAPASARRPLWLSDQPDDDPKSFGEPVSVETAIPPPDSLVYDDDYFDRVNANPMHLGRLNDLASYYRR